MTLVAIIITPASDAIDPRLVMSSQEDVAYGRWFGDSQ